MTIEPANGKALFNLASFLMNQGDVAGAQQAFEKIASAAPYVTSSLERLGEIHLSQGRIPQALESLNAAVDSGSENWKTFYLMGRGYRELGDWEAAVEALVRARELEPAELDIILDLGDAYFAGERVDEAEDEYKKALVLDPDTLHAHFQIAQIYLNQKRYALALEHVEQALRLDSSHVGAHFIRGAIHAQKGELEAAAASLEGASRLDPSHAQIHEALGEVYLQMGRAPQGEAELERARELQSLWDEVGQLHRRVASRPDDAQARLTLARTYRASSARWNEPGIDFSFSFESIPITRKPESSSKSSPPGSRTRKTIGTLAAARQFRSQTG